MTEAENPADPARKPKRSLDVTAIDGRVPSDRLGAIAARLAARGRGRADREDAAGDGEFEPEST